MTGPITFAACITLAAAPVYAAPVSLRHGDVQLEGDLREVSPGGMADGVIMLVHGTLAHHRMELIETLQSLLTHRGYNTLAVTLSLGVSARRGMYECELPHRHRNTDAIAEIGVWRAWLTRRGAGSVTLLGHSRGGNQAARFALTDGASLRALVLVAPATFDAARIRTRYQAAAGTALDDVTARARAVSGDTRIEVPSFLHCGPSRVTAGTFLSYYADDGLHDTPSLLPRITVPTLVVAGSADTTVVGLESLTRPHVGAGTRLVIVEGADHFFRDLYAEDVADAIDEFLKE